MAKPSVYRQVEATPIAKDRLKDSPRHWNNGLFEYRGRLWMCYRYHLMAASGRCKTAICPIDEKTLQPSGPSQMLELPEKNGDEHQEDARLFCFRGEPYVSYTEMTGYRPGVDFRCVMKYARLKLTGKKWSVVESWMPSYGKNDWTSKEKNWVFFEHAERLYCVYSGDPEHVVLEIDRGRVVNEYRTPRAVWEWGVFRGGTPPIRNADGNFLAIFHSSIANEAPPHYTRYFAGAYLFEGAPPFRILGISPRPILSGSEEDGHEVDPRYTAGWKPYVVFPCGIVARKEKYLVSFGINDWQSAIATLPAASMPLVAPDGSETKARYFRRENGTMPVSIVSRSAMPRQINWMVPAGGPGCSAGAGYAKITNMRDAEELLFTDGVQEIEEREFNRAARPQNSSSMVYL